jgi:hypothetical protein
MADTDGGLRQATRMALTHAGTGVLREPRRFVGLVSDYLGLGAPEVRVLSHTMGMGYVERFANAADAGTAPWSRREKTTTASATCPVGDVAPCQAEPRDQSVDCSKRPP